MIVGLGPVLQPPWRESVLVGRNFPVPDHRESVGRTAEGLRNLGAWVRQEGPVSKDFPAFSLWIRELAPETSSRSRSVPKVGRQEIRVNSVI